MPPASAPGFTDGDFLIEAPGGTLEAEPNEAAVAEALRRRALLSPPSVSPAEQPSSEERVAATESPPSGPPSVVDSTDNGPSPPYTLSEERNLANFEHEFAKAQADPRYFDDDDDDDYNEDDFPRMGWE